MKFLLIFLICTGVVACAKSDGSGSAGNSGYTSTYTGGFNGTGGTFYFPVSYSPIVLKNPQAAAAAVSAITIQPDGSFTLTTYYDYEYYGIAKSKFYQTGKINEYSNLVSDYWSCGGLEHSKLVTTTQIIQEGDTLKVTVFIKNKNEFDTFIATKEFKPEKHILESIDPNASFECNLLYFPY